MRRFIFFLACGVAACGAAIAAARPAAKPSFSVTATVTRVTDGDTIRVRYGTRSDRVRLIGIDAPEVGSCYASQATTVAERLIAHRPVRLIGDATQGRRDRYGRLLAYVRLSSGRDLGREVIAAGAAVVYVYSRPFAKLAAYRSAEATARAARRGMWSACATPQPIVHNCAASYPSVCIPPPPPDLDCAQISYRNVTVRWDVPDPDPHHFDGDRDGLGCET